MNQRAQESSVDLAARPRPESSASTVSRWPPPATLPRRGRRARQARGPEPDDPRLRRVAPPAQAGADPGRPLRPRAAGRDRDRRARAARRADHGAAARTPCSTSSSRRQGALVGAQGVPAGHGARQHHARRPAGGPPRPADPRDGRRSTSSARPPASKEGGVLTQVTNEINVEALPMEVPAAFEVDVSRARTSATSLRLSRPRRCPTASRCSTIPTRPSSRPSRSRRARRARGRGAPRAKRAPRRPRAAEAAAEGVPTPAAATAASPAPRGVAACASGRGATAPSLDLLVAGLGNPGREYARNRHNVGWHGRRRARAPARRRLEREVQRPARRDPHRRAQGRAAQARDVHERLRAAPCRRRRSSSSSSPTRCSSSTTRATSTLGRLQARLGGGLAGHNGLRSIAQHLGTPEFLRLRVGVGRPERGDPRPLADYVLSDFEPARRRRARSSPRPPTRSSRSTPRGSRRRSARSTAAARNRRHARANSPRCSANRAPAGGRPAWPVAHGPARPTPSRDARSLERVVAAPLEGRHCAQPTTARGARLSPARAAPAEGSPLA